MNIGEELLAFLAPLARWDSPVSVGRELQRMGLLRGRLGLVPEPIATLVESTKRAMDDIQAVLEAQDPAGAALAALEGARSVMNDVGAIASTDPTALPWPFGDREWWTRFATTLPAYLLAEYLRGTHPIATEVLRLVGALAPSSRDAPETLQVAALRSLLTTPAEHLRERLLADPRRLRSAIAAIAAFTARKRSRTSFVLDGQQVVAHEDLTAPRFPGLAARLLGVLDGLPVGLSITFDLEDDGSLLVSASLIGSAGPQIQLSRTTTLDITAQGDAGLTLRLSTAGLEVPPGAADASLDVALRTTLDEPWVLIGDAGGQRVELDGFDVDVSARVSAHEAPVLGASLDLDGLRWVLLPAKTDSFLATLLGNGELAGETSLSMAWNSETGLSFEGGADVELSLPVGRSLGPFSLDEIRLRLHAGDDGFAASAGITVRAELGPLAFAVEDLGVALQLERSASSTGAFGELDFALGFQPPKGLGLAIESSLITGGGYLYCDAEAGEYAGVAQLKMAEIGITAIGMLSTKLPDGWSLFLSLSAAFTGIPLGFGFTLNGLGGIIGINRGLDKEALGAGVRTGALNAILFPEDPVAQAPQILAALDEVFPKRTGQYVFGPVVKIGWGAPTLIEADLGMVLQVPSPITVSLLGALSAVLPTKEAPLVELHVDVVATLDIMAATLEISASLHDSRVLALELTGDMEVRASFRDDPTFLIAIGGFHPDFEAPAGFPSMRRLAVGLDTGDDVRIQLGGYFALTSNTVQFGAELSLWAKALGFTAEGGTSFDALIQFSPFHFTVDVHAWLTISAGGMDVLGVDLAAKLDGPNPWTVAGTASFKLFGVKKHLDVGATFGKKQDDAPREVVDVEELLVEELSRDDAWSAVGPAGDGDPVVLVAEDEEACEVHPAGRVRVAQRLVPLGVELECYGNASLVGVRRFELGAPRLGSHEVGGADIEPVTEWFAAAQYFELTEDEKLAAPSFERMTAGVVLGDRGVTAGTARPFARDHEIVYRDPNVRDERQERPGTVVATTAKAVERALSFGRALATRTRTGAPRSTKASGAFAAAAPAYVALDPVTGAATTAAGGFFAARTAAPGAVVVGDFELELMR